MKKIILGILVSTMFCIQLNAGSLKVEKLATLKNHTLSVSAVAFSPDGKFLASASEDKTIKLWDVETGECIATLKGHTDWVRSVAFSPNGKTLASASDDKTIILWDVSNPKKPKCIATLEGHTGWVISVAFSPDGKTLASASSDKTIKLWDVKSGAYITTLKDHTSWVNSVAFSPNGELLASASDDNTIILWKLTYPHTAFNNMKGKKEYYDVIVRHDDKIKEKDKINDLCSDFKELKFKSL